MKFVKEFKGVKKGDIYPSKFLPGQDCPEELEGAAKAQNALDAAAADKAAADKAAADKAAADKAAADKAAADKAAADKAAADKAAKKK